MISARASFLSALFAACLVSAESGCRCGDAAFLAIPRINLPVPEQIRPCPAYSRIVVSTLLKRSVLIPIPELIDARGSGEPQGVSLMFQNVISNLLVNSTDTAYQAVVYPADFDQNVASGVQNLLDLIEYGLQDCPSQKYFLFGYSQGATVLQQALAQLDNKTLDTVQSVVMVGNPYRLPGRVANVDSQGRADNRSAYGLFAVQAMKSNSTMISYNDDLGITGKVQDICLEVSTLYCL
ncbi:hypothetical protein IG631_07632 [Alternaria alternata]|nr:hypothetical protein IG631_07632 [Alternaria alternata]